MNGQNWEHMQPLRIPGGWTIMFNKFEDVEPEEIPSEDKRWLFYFTEDIVNRLEKWLFCEFMPIYFIDEDIFPKKHKEKIK